MTKVPLPLRALPSVAYRVWFTPPPLGRRAATQDSEAMAHVEQVRIRRPDGAELVGFATGSGPLVLAFHGWGGRAAQMTTMARNLTDAGLRVVAVDLPGHAGGDATDIKQMGAAIRDLIEVVGEPVAVIAHSFAAMALRMLFHDRAPATMVLLAPALKVSDAFSVFADRARLLPWTRTSLWRRLERWDPTVFPRLDQISADDFPGADVLMIHDPADDETPFATATELAALRPGTDLMAVEGVGHVGVLSSPEALGAVTEFVGRRNRAAGERALARGQE